MSPQNLYVEVISPSISKCDPVWRTFTKIIRLKWCHWSSTQFNIIGVFTKRRNLKTENAQGEHRGTMKAEIRVTRLHAKECLRLPANHRSWKRGMRKILPHSLQRNQPCLYHSFRLLPLEPGDNQFWLSKPPSGGYTVMAGMSQKTSTRTFLHSRNQPLLTLNRILIYIGNGDCQFLSIFEGVLWLKLSFFLISPVLMVFSHIW